MQYNIKALYMAKETKSITIRIPVTMYEDLTKDDMFNPSLVAFYERVKGEEENKMMDIRGIFSPNEWKALVSSLNGTMVTDYTRYSIEMFIAHNEDAEQFEGSFSNFNVKVEDVNAKIAKLTRIQVSTIYDRITAFWDNQNGMGDSLDKWAKF